MSKERDLIRKEHTVYEVLTRYPELKPVLQALSPKFKKLDNPVAFNTLARITTLERAAKIGGVYLRELLYRLNEALGLGADYLAVEKAAIQDSLRSGEALKKVVELVGKHPSKGMAASSPPSWIEAARNFPTMDLRTLAEDPFDRVMKLAEGTKAGEGFILVQSFEPLPLLANLSQKGFLYHTERIGAQEYKIYLIKER
ncbi:MAG: DUF1858 domain-containing protein [Spirochaetes bacterium]|nr:DUF1858 domain-containing protein [Spirochaetota bacterium]